MRITKNLKTILLALIVMALWGSLFPFIKIGYNAFSIDSTNIPSILMFAGTRFIVCGIIISLVTLLKNKLSKGTRTNFPRGKAILEIFLIGLFTIILHYSLLYIGISITDSSKTAIIKQLGSLFYVCLAFLFIKNEKFNVWKIVGAFLGFLGIIAINFSTSGVNFSYGDILIIGASFCTVVANIISKKVLSTNSAFWVTGISQLFGGCVLFVISLILGADILSFNFNALLVFAYICTASIIGYVLWNCILSTNNLSNMFIIKFSEPLFACVFGALLLGENIFKWQYLIAFVLISFGIVLGNKKNEKMTAKIFEIKRFAVHDGDGIRTTVFFKGCPLRCVWCHNPEGLSAKTEVAFYEHKCIGCGECKRANFQVSDCLGEARTGYGREISIDDLLPLLLEDREFYENSGGGVTLSGGECLVQADFCAELLKELKKNGIQTAVDTCGFVSKETLHKVIPYTDVFLYDLKAYDEDVHIKCTGKSNKIILENLEYLNSLGKSVEIRIPYVPDYNDSEMEKISDFLKPLKSITKIRVLPYHNYARGKYVALNIKDTLPDRIPRADEIELAKVIIKRSGHKVI